MRMLPQSYAEAVRLDPNFALAGRGLSIVTSFLYYQFRQILSANSAVAVKEAGDRAMSLCTTTRRSMVGAGHLSAT